MQLIRFKNGEMNAVGNQQLKERREEKKKEKMENNAHSMGKYCPMKVLSLV